MTAQGLPTWQLPTWTPSHAWQEESNCALSYSVTGGTISVPEIKKINFSELWLNGLGDLHVRDKGKCTSDSQECGTDRKQLKGPKITQNQLVWVKQETSNRCAGILRFSHPSSLWWSLSQGFCAQASLRSVLLFQLHWGIHRVLMKAFATTCSKEIDSSFIQGAAEHAMTS